MKVANIDIFDVEELACKITGLDYYEINADSEIIETKLIEELQIDLWSFKEIVSRLIPLIDVGKSPITEKTYKGFADAENSIWLIKTEVK